MKRFAVFHKDSGAIERVISVSRVSMALADKTDGLEILEIAPDQVISDATHRVDVSGPEPRIVENE